MSARVRHLLAIAACFVILSAGECSIGDLGEILDEPGRIAVSNSGTVPAVIAIIADDVKSYPTLAGGSSTSVQTNVGGRYQVIVIMTPEQQIEYKAQLVELRRTVEALIDGTATSAEKTHAFVTLAGIKVALRNFEAGAAGSCSGNIKLDKDQAVTVNATVAWVDQSGSGFWDLTCGSSE